MQKASRANAFEHLEYFESVKREMKRNEDFIRDG